MKPVATYRVQLNKDFDFQRLKATLPYLAQLGISHVYASPIVQARPGSTHGYDATDTGKISEELGGQAAFEALHKKAAALGLEWLQDIVPNHVAYSPQGTFVSDVMMHGFNSKYHAFLDVDWNHPSPKLNGRILAPFLQEDYEVCLQKGQIKLAYHNGFRIRYGDMEFPVKTSSYRKILSRAPRTLPLSSKDDETLIHRLQHNDPDEALRTAVDGAVNRYNRDTSLLDELLSQQVYVLANWRTAFKEINYRRFFDLLDLICLRMEERDVFETTHKLTLRLVTGGKITGLRVDHVDGLRDPEEYLKQLRKAAPNAYIIIEKILLGGENLPASWPIQGTTGYDFLNQLNGLFIASQNEDRINAAYNKCTGNSRSFDEILYKCKKRAIQGLFSGDVENLTRMLIRLLQERPYGRECTARGTREALVELLSAFPVYRTYLSKVNAVDEHFEYSLQLAKQRNKKAAVELAAMEMLLEESASSKDALEFITRLQQFTGPVMAKGLEDTALYIYNRLLSLNEVGSDPAKFGISTENFHAFLSLRQTNWPMSLNATSTHDTKRGEDARARINVLSEIPSEMSFEFRKWARLNLKKKKTVNGKLVPSRNEEYYIYQTLIGAFPFDTKEVPEFLDRLKLHVVKAIREAKMNSSWLSSNLRYEEALTAFVTELLDTDCGNAFSEEFVPFQKKVAFYGFLNSLSQTLIKITSPGVPDFYQGTELWDLNMVDPDNRRPVDFQKRQKLLEDVRSSKPAEIHGLLENFEDGRMKLYEIHKALKTRSRKAALFQEGTYIPLTVKGALRNHIIAFCRKKGTSHAVTIAPRLLVNVTKPRDLPLGNVWKDTFVCLPQNTPRNWSEIFTQKSLVTRKSGDDEGLSVAEMLQAFPVALLLAGETDS